MFDNHMVKRFNNLSNVTQHIGYLPFDLLFFIQKSLSNASIGFKCWVTRVDGRLSIY
jgi:hypothetical protein